LSADDVRVLQEARDAGAGQPERIAREYFSDPALQAIGSRYLRDNIRYDLGDTELAGLLTFYRYAAELGLVPDAGELRFY
jgi:predicted solute-binding protein